MITFEKYPLQKQSRLAVQGVLALFCMALSFALHAQPRQIVPKLVFAHYMVCCPAAGGKATVEDYMAEMREAQSRGVDGFSLNSGGWSKSEPLYKQRTLLMYEAARRLGTGFKLFVSVDGKARDEVEDILQTVNNHPNQLRVGTKPVLSTFAGEGKTGEQGDELIARAHANGAFFIPYFYPRPLVRELPTETDARTIAHRYPDLDGFFYFGAAGTGATISEANAVSARAWRSRGKVYMASVTPYYIGGGNNYRAFETEGFTAMAQEWEAAIRNDASWVQIVTWNDWYEASYVAPFRTDKPDLGPKQLPNSSMPSHVAYLDASRYYIDWFKHGTPPVLKKDQLFYFYRLHPKTEDADIAVGGAAGKARPRGVNNLKDNVFVSAFLSQPGQVTIRSGGASKNFDLSAGVSHIELPFEPGKQQFILTRNGKILIEKTGERSISATDTHTRFNYFSGSVMK